MMKPCTLLILLSLVSGVKGFLLLFPLGMEIMLVPEVQNVAEEKMVDSLSMVWPDGCSRFEGLVWSQL